ncbi:MAG TPA: META domain-containing protein [Chryseolinea sp.]|nr:META domain-containing protein [Chryseolinea sp.]
MKIVPAFLLVLFLASVQCKPAKVSKTKSLLENTHWRLSEMNGNPIITLEGSRDVYFMMTSEKGQKKLTGFAGCNSITGGYTLSGDKVKFVIASTKMMCPEEQMAVEDFLLKALSSASSYRVEGNVLELFDGQTSLADFKAIETK